MATPLINGVSYGWGNIKLVLFGVPVVGITKIDYKTKQTKENIYGSGYKPVSRGYGKYEYEGSIELYTEEWKRIIAAAPNRDALSIAPFDIQVIFQGARVAPNVDLLRQCEFMEDPLSVSEGDTSIKVTIPLIIGDIVR
jgi:hypothetical protein